MKMFHLTVLLVISFFGDLLSAPQTSTDSPAGLDFFKLLPRKEIEDLANQHLKTDEGFKAAMKYMQGKEFTTLMDNLSKKEEWIKLKALLVDFNINVDIPIHCLRSYLKNITITGQPTAKKDLKAFMIDVSKVVPSTKILSMWHAKMQEPGFDKLFERLSSDASKKIVEDALKTEELRKFIDVLTDMGLEVKKALGILYTSFGWGEFKM